MYGFPACPKTSNLSVWDSDLGGTRCGLLHCLFVDFGLNPANTMFTKVDTLWKFSLVLRIVQVMAAACDAPGALQGLPPARAALLD